MKTKNINFLVFQNFYLNFAVFLSMFIKTYILLNFIHYYEKFWDFEEKSYVLPLYLMENGKVFKIIAPPQYSYSRLAWLYIYKRSWHNK